MRILLLGKNGQVGWALHQLLPDLGEVIAPNSEELNLLNLNQLRHVIRRIRPEIIINAAAYTEIENAEDNYGVAKQINSIAPLVIAEEAYKIKSVIIHFSTNYVFDGRSTVPYKETDIPNPINVYGKTKLEGEVAITSTKTPYLILRTSWVYSLRKKNFVTEILRKCKEQEKLYIAIDQVGSPTSSTMLALKTFEILRYGKKDIYSYLKKHSGTYHLSGNGSASRLEWVIEILTWGMKAEKEDLEIQKKISKDFPSKAQRPVFASLDCAKIQSVFKIFLPTWQDALKETFAKNDKINN